MEPFLGWHFLAVRGRLRDGSQALEEGVERYAGPLELCRLGLHASARAIDALTYAPGPIVRRVELLGERLDEPNKSVARERRVLWTADATRTLYEFACRQAESVLEHHTTDPKGLKVCRRAIATRRSWLDGEATDEELRAADAAADAYAAYADAAAVADATRASAAAFAASAAAYAVDSAFADAYAADAANAAAADAYAAAYAAAAVADATRAAAFAASAADSAANKMLEEMLEELAPKGRAP